MEKAELASKLVDKMDFRCTLDRGYPAEEWNENELERVLARLYQRR
jgi:hypothetical protein